MNARSRSWALPSLTLLLLAGPPAPAMPILFAGSQGDLSASALFEFSTPANSLTITLTNTSTADVRVPTHLLTGLFFDIRSQDPVTLSPLSAVLGSGSTVLFDEQPTGGVVGGEWAFIGGHSSLARWGAYGISATGLGLFGPHDRFPGPNLQGPGSPGGMEYGITSAGDDPTTGINSLTGPNALIRNRVDFTLAGLGDGFDPSTQIREVYWHYGTSLDDPWFAGTPVRPRVMAVPDVPEPAVGLMLAAGLLVSLAGNRRRRTAPS